MRKKSDFLTVICHFCLGGGRSSLQAVSAEESLREAKISGLSKIMHL